MVVLNCSPEGELRALRSTLLRLHGCEVVSPSSIEEAAREVQRRPFDVLLLCWHLRGEAGRRICQRFRLFSPAGRVVMVKNHEQHATCCLADAVVPAARPDELLSTVGGDQAGSMEDCEPS